MFFRPRYRYTNIPGGIKRSRLPPRTDQYQSLPPDTQYHPFEPPEYSQHRHRPQTQHQNDDYWDLEYDMDPVDYYYVDHRPYYNDATYPIRGSKYCPRRRESVHGHRPIQPTEDDAAQDFSFRQVPARSNMQHDQYVPTRYPEPGSRHFDERRDMHPPFDRDRYHDREARPYHMSGVRATRDGSPIHVRFPKTSSSPGMSFEAAAARLNQTTNHAINFFTTFKNGFDDEVHRLTAYANRATVKQAWKDKIVRNERYHDTPRDGWTRQARYHNNDPTWENGGNDANDDNQHQSGTRANEQGMGHLMTFREHLHEIRRSIDLFLGCQILEPRVRCNAHNSQHTRHRHYGYLDDDAEVEPEDSNNIAKHKSALRLRSWVIEAQNELLPLLDRVREDDRCMEAAIPELTHLARMLETFGRAWRQPRGVDSDDQGHEGHVEHE